MIKSDSTDIYNTKFRFQTNAFIKKHFININSFLTFIIMGSIS